MVEQSQSTQKQKSDDSDPAGMIFGLGLLFVFLIFICYNASIGSDLKSECHSIARKHNRTFAAKGLSWQIPNSFPKWIELRNDYLNEGLDAQPIYVPPVNPINQHPEVTFELLNDEEEVQFPQLQIG